MWHIIFDMCLYCIPQIKVKYTLLWARRCWRSNGPSQKSNQSKPSPPPSYIDVTNPPPYIVWQFIFDICFTCIPQTKVKYTLLWARSCWCSNGPSLNVNQSKTFPPPSYVDVTNPPPHSVIIHIWHFSNLYSTVKTIDSNIPCLEQGPNWRSDFWIIQTYSSTI